MKKKSKLPKFIMVLGRKITVVEQESLIFEGEPCVGLYEHEKRRILLSSSVSPDDKFFTFCHEVGHAYLALLGWDQALNDREQEVVCNAFALYTEDIVKAFRP